MRNVSASGGITNCHEIVEVAVISSARAPRWRPVFDAQHLVAIPTVRHRLRNRRETSARLSGVDIDELIDEISHHIGVCFGERDTDIEHITGLCGAYLRSKLIAFGYTRGIARNDIPRSEWRGSKKEKKNR